MYSVVVSSITPIVVSSDEPGLVSVETELDEAFGSSEETLESGVEDGKSEDDAPGASEDILGSDVEPESVEEFGSSDELESEDPLGSVEDPLGSVEDPLGSVEDPLGSVEDPLGSVVTDSEDDESEPPVLEFGDSDELPDGELDTASVDEPDSSVVAAGEDEDADSDDEASDGVLD